MSSRAKAQMLGYLIETACLNYKTEYNTLPETTENARLIKILMGDNPRHISLLAVKPTDLNSNGEEVDPWGTPLHISFNSDSSVRVVSAGPDKIFGTTDDVATVPGF